MDKQAVVHIHNGILQISSNEADETGAYYIE